MADLRSVAFFSFLVVVFPSPYKRSNESAFHNVQNPSGKLFPRKVGDTTALAWNFFPSYKSAGALLQKPPRVPCRVAGI